MAFSVLGYLGGLSGIETGGLIYTYRAGRFSTWYNRVLVMIQNNDDIDILKFTSPSL
jgi:hypothetical protein